MSIVPHRPKVVYGMELIPRIGRISAPMEAEMTVDDLTHIIIGSAYRVHNTLGPGFLEKVYENALRIELKKAGFRVKQQEPISVIYEAKSSESIALICGSTSGLWSN